MTKIKAIALTLCLLLALSFSGCASKIETVYVPQKCLVEKPIKSELKKCQQYGNDIDFMQCVAINYTTLQGDYEMMEKAFEGCK